MIQMQLVEADIYVRCYLRTKKSFLQRARSNKSTAIIQNIVLRVHVDAVEQLKANNEWRKSRRLFKKMLHDAINTPLLWQFVLIR